MILTIDIGNTNTVFGFFAEGTLINSSRFSTDNNITIDELSIKVSNILNFCEIDKKSITAVIVANVVPSLNRSYVGLINNLFRCKSYFVKDFLSELPIKISYKNVNELGDDRVANSIAGYCNYDQDLIIIDFGTAITFDVLSRKNGYVGGVILPGVNLAIEYLSNETAKLPEVAFEKTIEVIGKNTTHAIESGLFHGYLSMLEGMVKKIVRELNTKNYKIIATGGMGKIFADSSDIIDTYNADLTLKGLYILYNHITS